MKRIGAAVFVAAWMAGASVAITSRRRLADADRGPKAASG